MTETRDLGDGITIIATLLILGFALLIMAIADSEFLTIAIILWIFLIGAIVLTYKHYWGDYEAQSTVSKPERITKLSGYDTSSSVISTKSERGSWSVSRDIPQHTTHQLLMQRTPASILEIVIFGGLIGIIAFFINVIAGGIISFIVSFFIWVRIDQNNYLLSKQIQHLNKQLEIPDKV